MRDCVPTRAINIKRSDLSSLRVFVIFTTSLVMTIKDERPVKIPTSTKVTVSWFLRMVSVIDDDFVAVGYPFAVAIFGKCT